MMNKEINTAELLIVLINSHAALVKEVVKLGNPPYWVSPGGQEIKIRPPTSFEGKEVDYNSPWFQDLMKKHGLRNDGGTKNDE